jgi:hypothetical protein
LEGTLVIFIGVILHLFRWREKNSDQSALQVLNAMTGMDTQMFKKHLPEFYPYFTKLICLERKFVQACEGVDTLLLRE